MTDDLELLGMNDLDLITKALRASKAPGPTGYWFRNLADIIDDLRVQRDNAEIALMEPTDDDGTGRLRQD